MAFDAHANFGYSTVAVAPVPADSGTSLQVAAGQGALFPAAPFNCTIWPSGVNPLLSNAEIIRVTAIVGDTLTIVRSQEGTAARNIEVGWQIANTTTRKVFTDIENAVVISAGTQAASGPFTFANGGGITFGMDNGTLTATVAAGGGGVAISAGGNSQSTGTVVFGNANGITFGLDGAGNLTASHNGLTSQSNQAFSAQGGSSTFQTLSFNNANGISFSNVGGAVQASYTVPSTAGLISFINLSAGTTSNNSSAFTFANANGITFGLDNGTITASYIPGAGASINFSAGTTSNNLTAVTFGDANGISFGLNGSVITGSHNALTSQSNQAASASNGSFTFQTLNFSDANGITFGTSAGGIITASHNGLTSQSNQAASASNGSFTFQTLNFSNANGITFGTSAGGIISASHNGLTSQSNQAASASNGSFTFQTLAFSNANNVTFGTSAGSIITASVAPAGGGGTVSQFYPWPTHLVAVGGIVSNSASVIYLQVPSNITFTRIAVPMQISLTTTNNNSTGGINFSVTAVIHTLNAGTLNSLGSTTYSTGMTLSSNNTGGVTGPFFIPCVFASSLSPANYWLALRIATANTGGVITGANTTALGWTHSCFGVGTAAFTSALSIRELQVTANNSNGWLPHHGMYTGTTNLTQIAVSDIVATASQNRVMIGLQFIA